MMTFPRPRWRSWRWWLRMIVVALAVADSAVVAVLQVWVLSLLHDGYSGRSSPASLSGLAVFFALAVLVFAELPAALLGAGLWVAVRRIQVSGLRGG